ncbi:Phosphoglycerate mutase 2-like [Quillaja saponaria]|uniref:Phosphoglycerate mutase 2-like n=1 Tax=Quillaja saponaria TaxID=32244 RepID=A0AAD7M237_QUISA|nr:Phosphoglycerate mutase 2-like [Quillaja saponaria]
MSNMVSIFLLANKLEKDFSLTGLAYNFTKATISLTNGLLLTSKKITLVRHGLSSRNAEKIIQGHPISRAKTPAEIILQGREKPLVFLDSLREAHLYFLEGMTNGRNARQINPKEYTALREDPANFFVSCVYPIQELRGLASETWRLILLTPGENFLVGTHKSTLRALICTALGLTPERFHAIDINNCGISAFNLNKRGDSMLQFNIEHDS